MREREREGESMSESRSKCVHVFGNWEISEWTPNRVALKRNGASERGMEEGERTILIGTHANTYG